MADFEKKDLKKKSENISDWYTDVILKAELADYGPARGTMVIRPYGYAIWENLQRELDREIKASGAENAYFPMFIPNSLFKKEKEHIEGFAPETAVVIHGGGEKLADPLIVRPTSEMVMYNLYAKWIHSWRDLPMVINQWNNVVRWEKRTYLFLRTSEFLWQEGHGAHATPEENSKRVLWGIETYAKIYKDIFAIDGLVGRKSESEKFAGADSTLTYEMLMPGGKALQGCTSHDLGQNFSKSLEIKFQDKSGNSQYVWQNSWGFSTRSIGALILSHGDDSGLVFPPKLAPIRAVVLPILGKKDTEILKYCLKVKEALEKDSSNFPGKVIIDDDPEKSYGWKVNEAELKGVPVRITVGTRELYDKVVTITDRLGIEKDKKVRLSEVHKFIEELLSQIQKALYAQSEKFLKEHTRDTSSYDEFKKIMNTSKGFIKALWCEDDYCEEKIKAETKATTRCKPLDAKEEKGKCIYCGKEARYKWYFAQAY